VLELGRGHGVIHDAPRPIAVGPLCTACSSARHLQRHFTSSDRDLLVKDGSRGEEWPVNLACDSDFHINHRVLMPQTYDMGQTILLRLRRKA
jgi:hypothetical protein